MFLQNLEFEKFDAVALRNELLGELNDEPIPSAEEVKDDLANLYNQADVAMKKKLFNASESSLKSMEKNFSAQDVKENIWDQLRKHLCNILNEDSTAAEIIDAILEFIITMIPGGIFVRWILKKIIRYVLDLGYGALCPA